MVVVGEDVAVDGGVAGRRGLTGTILVHKVDSCRYSLAAIVDGLGLFASLAVHSLFHYVWLINDVLITY